MPFDGTLQSLAGSSTKPTSLIDIGLVPIDPTRAADWREHVTRRFTTSGRRQAALVEIGLARWATTSFRLNYFSKAYQAAYSMPRVVRRLLNKIGHAFPNATCTIDYFDTDPILHVVIDDTPHCIAIWDGGVVRAIADGVKLPVHQRCLRLFVDTI